MNYTEDFLLDLISPYEKNNNATKLLSNTINWEHFFEKAYSHRIAPLILWNLKKRGLSSRVPDYILHKLQMAYLYTLQKNMTFTEELKQILSMFEKERIPCIVLKGFSFINTIYEGNVGARPLKDIDLLIRRKDLERAGKTLSKMGYQFYGRWASEPYYLESHFHLPFEKSKGQYFFVELHWHLLPPNYPVRIDIERLWERSVQLNLEEMETKALHPEDELIYLIWHSAFNGFDELLSLSDLLKLIGHYEFNWDKIINLVKDARLKIPFYQAFHIANNVFDLDLLPRIQIDMLSKNFIGLFYTKKNVMEQFITSDWLLSRINHLFIFEDKSFGIKEVLNSLPPFPKSIRTIGHYVSAFLRIGARYVKRRVH